MKSSICAYKRGEPFFTTYHWCNECPPIKEYLQLERQQKLAWTNRNKKKKEAWEIKHPKAAARIKNQKLLGHIA